MPISDLWVVFRWWGTLFLIGAAAFPVTSLLFHDWYDRGYVFSKAVGMMLVSWLVFVLGMSHVLPFTMITVAICVAVVFFAGIMLHAVGKTKGSGRRLYARIGIEEIVFFAALLFWSWIKAHEPSIRGLEKFMDYGFMNSILHSRYFPPVDMWYPPATVNYYYFGHLVVAILTKFSGLDLSYTFNLMLASIFAFCLTMTYAVGYTLVRSITGIRRWVAVLGGALTAFLATLAGNMQTVYAFTQGYDGDHVQPFWSLAWPLWDFWVKLPQGIERYWYANATRFIPYTIHEFPSYSFVVSDVHGHVLSIPFVLLAIALLLEFFGNRPEKQERWDSWPMLVFYGCLSGVLLMTNALDGPIYAGLFVILLAVLFPGDWGRRSYWTAWGKRVGVVVLAAMATSLPFLMHFNSFVHGVAVNCPPSFLANSHIGPILFEGVEKCQKSPFWMMWLLWGFFWFCGAWFLGMRYVLSEKKLKKMPLWQRIQHMWNTEYTRNEKVLGIFFFFSILLIVFPEFFYFKDIYPTHFRSNTMFKLGYQAFFLFSFVSGYAIVFVLHAFNKGKKKTDFRYRNRARTAFLVLLLPQLFLVAIYPVFSVRSYFGGLKMYDSIWGLGWLAKDYPSNFAAMQWLDAQKETAFQQSVIVEADGDSYTDYDQFSVFTGMPTVVGWAVHEWLWRGSYDVVAPRRNDVRTIYETTDEQEALRILRRYHVRYVIVGTLEREKYPELDESKFSRLGNEIYQAGTTAIYSIPE